MKTKILSTLVLLIIGGSAMAYVTGWDSGPVIAESASGHNMFSQAEMIILWLSGLVGLYVIRKRSFA